MPGQGQHTQTLDIHTACQCTQNHTHLEPGQPGVTVLSPTPQPDQTSLGPHVSSHIRGEKPQLDAPTSLPLACLSSVGRWDVCPLGVRMGDHWPAVGSLIGWTQEATTIIAGLRVPGVSAPPSQAILMDDELSPGASLPPPRPSPPTAHQPPKLHRHLHPCSCTLGRAVCSYHAPSIFRHILYPCLTASVDSPHGLCVPLAQGTQLRLMYLHVDK